MSLRRLGHFGPELTTVGFGAWAIGGPWRFGWGDVDDDDSVAAIRHAIELAAHELGGAGKLVCDGDHRRVQLVAGRVTPPL